MPTFRFSVAIPIGGTVQPLTGWQYEYLPWPAQCTVLAQVTADGILNVITSGSETITEESPVQAGGVKGVTPSPLNTPPDSWIAAAGDRLKLSYRNPTAGIVDLAGVIDVEPVG